MIRDLIAELARAAVEGFKRNLAFMLYGGAEAIDGLTSLLSLGFYQSDIVRTQAAEDLAIWLGYWPGIR